MKKIRNLVITTQLKKFKVAFLLVFLCLVFCLSISAVSAADIYVNGSGDDTTGTGTIDNPYKTISYGISQASETTVDTVILSSGTFNTNTDADHKDYDITISKNVNIKGAGQDQTIIDAENNARIFTILSGYTVTISDLKLTNGYTTSNGGAIDNSGTLIAENCDFTNNHAVQGGAIQNYNGGSVNADNCDFTNNQAVYYAGAIENNNGGTITIDNCDFTNNQAGSDAGAIDNYGTLNVNNCDFTNNQAGWGGAIQTYGTSIVNSCTFNGNTVTEDGGAIYNSGSMTVENCVFTCNQASKSGGAIYHRIHTLPRTLTVTGCNFYQNIAGTTGGAINMETISTVAVKYSRLVGNTAGTSGQDIYIYSGDLDARYNWWGSNTGPAAGRITQVEGTPSDEIYTPWLVMNINVNPSTIYTGATSQITTNVYTDSNGVDHSADAAQFFSGPEVTFTTDLGNVGSKSVTVNWTRGSAVATLRGDEGPGVATVTAADVGIISTTVTILQAPTPSGNDVNAAQTVGMQKTGVPFAGLILAILAVFAGLLVPKKRS